MKIDENQAWNERLRGSVALPLEREIVQLLRFTAHAIHQTLASSATLQISRWALAGVSPRFPSETDTWRAGTAPLSGPSGRLSPRGE